MKKYFLQKLGLKKIAQLTMKQGLILVGVFVVCSLVGVYATDQLQQSYRSLNGATTVGVANGTGSFNSDRIEEHGDCQTVTSNSCGNDVFIPTASTGERTGFTTYHPACIQITGCNLCPFADIVICSSHYNACQVWKGCNSDLGSGVYFAASTPPLDKNNLSYTANTASSKDSNGYPYGKLYDPDYLASNPTAVCPTGYHLPSNADFLTLSNMLAADGTCNYPSFGSNYHDFALDDSWLCNSIQTTLKLPAPGYYGRWWDPIIAFHGHDRTLLDKSYAEFFRGLLQVNKVYAAESSCGNGFCESAKSETCYTCSADCGSCPPPYCGDGHIDAGENCDTCPQDVGHQCSYTASSRMYLQKSIEGAYYVTPQLGDAYQLDQGGSVIKFNAIGISTAVTPLNTLGLFYYFIGDKNINYSNYYGGRANWLPLSIFNGTTLKLLSVLPTSNALSTISKASVRCIKDAVPTSHFNCNAIPAGTYGVWPQLFDHLSQTYISLSGYTQYNITGVRTPAADYTTEYVSSTSTFNPNACAFTCPAGSVWNGTNCRDCALPWGGTLANGSGVTAYADESPTCGVACDSETRTCTNGVLGGTYTNQNCTSCTPVNGVCSVSNRNGINEGGSYSLGLVSFYPNPANCSVTINEPQGYGLHYQWNKLYCSQGTLGALNWYYDTDSWCVCCYKYHIHWSSESPTPIAP